MNASVCQINDFLKELKAEYSKDIASQAKRIMFLLNERSFLPDCSVSLDTNMLDRVFRILIDNAVKYTDKGYIKAGYHVLDNDILQFFVEDTGSGFDPVILEEVTRYFSSAETPSGEAAGNLSEVNRLVRSMDGKVRIESQQDMGTTVYFGVAFDPAAATGDSRKTATERAAVSHAEKEAPQHAKTNTVNDIWSGKTILIAEDEIVNYMFLEVLFEETGAALIHASDGVQAIDAVKANPAINIVLMDIKMPHINGLEATRQIKTMRPQLPVIAQTAYAMQDDEYKALQAGCNDYISKPIDANKLIGLMKKYLSHSNN
jgi:CheY-like chemotaxis protein